MGKEIYKGKVIEQLNEKRENLNSTYVLMYPMVLKVEFERKFEQKFRELAMNKYGFSKGSIKKASEEAIRKWINEEDKKLPELKNPIKLIIGSMKQLRGKYTSVELQHEAPKIWISKT